MKIATWANHRPVISVWYDEWLKPNAPDRHFWFGFQGRKERIKALYEEFRECGAGAPAVYDNSHFTKGRGSALTLVKRSNGLVYEKYRGDDHYLGNTTLRSFLAPKTI